MHPVRRDAQHWQVGIDPDATVLLSDDPSMRALLACVSGGDLTRGALTSASATAALDALSSAGLLVEPTPPRFPRPIVALVGSGPEHDQLGDLLGPDLASDEGVIDLCVIATTAPLPRASLDGWLADGTPHLTVSGTGRPGRLRVGPFVEPGVTACVRCIDAHESTSDPRRPLILEQLAVLPAGPVPPSTRALAVAWVAHDVAAFVRGDRPSTWSATIDVGGGVPERREWERHPHCGCAWDQLY
ncbi:MAG: hypothetical protein WB767_11225 [Nocardioides sp.]